MLYWHPHSGKEIQYEPREEITSLICKMYFQMQVQVKELYLNCEEGEIMIVALRVSAMVQIKLGSNFWDILFPPKDEANQFKSYQTHSFQFHRCFYSKAQPFLLLRQNHFWWNFNWHPSIFNHQLN